MYDFDMLNNYDNVMENDQFYIKHMNLLSFRILKLPVKKFFMVVPDCS